MPLRRTVAGRQGEEFVRLLLQDVRTWIDKIRTKKGQKKQECTEKRRNLNAITFSIASRECRCCCRWCEHFALYCNKHFAEEEKRIQMISEMINNEHGNWNETREREEKSKSVWRVQNLTMNKREIAMNVLWCMWKISREMLCVCVWVDHLEKRPTDYPERVYFPALYKCVLSSWVNQWTKRSLEKKTKILKRSSHRHAHAH